MNVDIWYIIYYIYPIWLIDRIETHHQQLKFIKFVQATWFVLRTLPWHGTYMQNANQIGTNLVANKWRQCAECLLIVALNGLKVIRMYAVHCVFVMCGVPVPTYLPTCITYRHRRKKMAHFRAREWKSTKKIVWNSLLYLQFYWIGDCVCVRV